MAVDKNLEGTSTNLDTTNHVIIEEDVEDVATFREKKTVRKLSKNKPFSATAKIDKPIKPNLKIGQKRGLEKNFTMEDKQLTVNNFSCKS